MSFDALLEPISKMAAAGGPMNVTPCSVQALQNSAFSERNPAKNKGIKIFCHNLVVGIRTNRSQGE